MLCCDSWLSMGGQEKVPVRFHGIFASQLHGVALLLVATSSPSMVQAQSSWSEGQGPRPSSLQTQGAPEASGSLVTDAISSKLAGQRPTRIRFASQVSDASDSPSRKSTPERVPARQIAFAIESESGTSLATPQMLAWLERLIRNNLPEDYEDDGNWNQQREVWDGIQFRREGWRLETKRKKKLVNAGTWTRYRISLVEPDENLFIEFQELEVLSDGRIAFSVTVECSLDVFGRLSQWVRDVQLVSISANADAAARLTLEGTVRLSMNPLEVPPGVSLRPRIDRANVELTYYRVRRVSQVGGELAEMLGKGLRGIVDKKIEDMNSKLVDKINRQLERHADKLSFSAQQWMHSRLSQSEAAKLP